MIGDFLRNYEVAFNVRKNAYSVSVIEPEMTDVAISEPDRMRRGIIDTLLGRPTPEFTDTAQDKICRFTLNITSCLKVNLLFSRFQYHLVIKHNHINYLIFIFFSVNR